MDELLFESEVIDYTSLLEEMQSSIDGFKTSIIEVIQGSSMSIQETTLYGFLMLYACVGILWGALLIRHLRR